MQPPDYHSLSRVICSLQACDHWAIWPFHHHLFPSLVLLPNGLTQGCLLDSDCWTSVGFHPWKSIPTLKAAQWFLLHFPRGPRLAKGRIHPSVVSTVRAGPYFKGYPQQDRSLAWVSLCMKNKRVEMQNKIGWNGGNSAEES